MDDGEQKIQKFRSPSSFPLAWLRSCDCPFAQRRFWSKGEILLDSARSIRLKSLENENRRKWTSRRRKQEGERIEKRNRWLFFFGPLALPPSIQSAAFFSSSPKVSAASSDTLRHIFRHLRVGNRNLSPGSSLPCSWFAQSPTENCVNVSVSSFFQ